jgi:phosphoglucosamine mutase
LVLGGEQSGHIVFLNEATTGDGIRTALRLLELLARKGRPLGELARETMTRYPQVMRNVAVRDPRRLGEAATVWAAVAEAEFELGSRGRILVRASGTEEAVRVMVEAESLEEAIEMARRLADVVATELGTSLS